MELSFLQLLAGVALLYLGGEALVSGAVRTALRMRISPLVVGLTVVSLGTSAPELVVSVGASFSGASDIAVGNVVGSNIANVFLVLGLSALIRPIGVRRQLLRVDVPILIACSLGLPLVLRGGISRLEGAALLTALGLYTWSSVVRENREAADPEAHAPVAGLYRIPEWVLLFVGLVALVGGARLFVAGAVELATSVGVSEVVIGLTVVALGTSLPELSACVLAAARGHGDIAMGNVVGSNVFNTLGILGAAALASPIADSGITPVDLAAMAAAPVLLLPFAWTGLTLNRTEGAIMLACYFVYIATRFA